MFLYAIYPSYWYKLSNRNSLSTMEIGIIQTHNLIKVSCKFAIHNLKRNRNMQHLIVYINPSNNLDTNPKDGQSKEYST